MFRKAGTQTSWWSAGTALGGSNSGREKYGVSLKIQVFCLSFRQAKHESTASVFCICRSYFLRDGQVIDHLIGLTVSVAWNFRSSLGLERFHPLDENDLVFP